MKLNKLFLGLLAAGLFVSCSNDDSEGPAGPGAQKTETSYIAVNVNGVFDRTRAADGGYEDGTADEQKVTNAHFFFFTNSGAAFALNAESLTNPTDLTNYIVKDLTDSGNELDPNVETITNAVITIQNNKGDIPAKMVVVLNWDGVSEKMVSLADLKAHLLEEAKLHGANGFVMSNSVYADGASVIDATPITTANIAATSTDALAMPVDIYVERVAAKVTVKEDAGPRFDTGIANPGASGGNVYAEIVGWDVNTTLNKSYLVKHIDVAWANNLLGTILWNDLAYHRSYWANSVKADNINALYETSFSWNDVAAANAVDASAYCTENAGDDATKNTKVLVAAKFVDAGGNKVDIVKLFAEYLTIADLKARIASSLATTYYYGDAYSKTSIAPEHIELMAAGTSGEDSHKVTYKLSAAAEALTWYSFDGSAYTQLADANTINNRLASFAKAEVWDGMGYYFVDIEHLSSNAIKGVVRNHSYVITVEDIKGLGTAVYNPDNEVVEPVNPGETESFIAARINVLSWKLVNQNVTLE